ncbi:putative quinol monooxygenase [Pseudomonas sp. UBA2684]|uniref:putative quinol monooxygenase n=1 Tax=Pseudomonas sp. UBA2684 TaxID=1947311 RepID=UPI000E828F13|nr:putative quinol monooxygenase [Pseudomonas sp. UBA2684]HBX56254.1 antibiotic biosynthesis monooxygenase [Pseudomonas sp.]
MSTPLTLIATLTALDGQAEVVEAGLRLLVAASRQEAGCLQYDLHRHQDNPQRFIMIEQWQNSAALNEHQNTAHYQHFGSTCGERLQGVDLQLMHRIA